LHKGASDKVKIGKIQKRAPFYQPKPRLACALAPIDGFSQYKLAGKVNAGNFLFIGLHPTALTITTRG
jgi:hypothetical protein